MHLVARKEYNSRLSKLAVNSRVPSQGCSQGKGRKSWQLPLFSDGNSSTFEQKFSWTRKVNHLLQFAILAPNFFLTTCLCSTLTIYVAMCADPQLVQCGYLRSVRFARLRSLRFLHRTILKSATEVKCCLVSGAPIRKRKRNRKKKFGNRKKSKVEVSS